MLGHHNRTFAYSYHGAIAATRGFASGWYFMSTDHMAIILSQPVGGDYVYRS